MFLETAHPIKFLDVVEPLINKNLDIPKQIQTVINKEKVAAKINNYSDLKAFLLS